MTISFLLLLQIMRNAGAPRAAPGIAAPKLRKPLPRNAPFEVRIDARRNAGEATYS